MTRGEAKVRWAAFHKDPEWQQARTASEVQDAREQRDVRVQGTDGLLVDEMTQLSTHPMNQFNDQMTQS